MSDCAENARSHASALLPKPVSYPVCLSLLTMSSTTQKRKFAPSVLADGAFTITRFLVAEEPSFDDVYAMNFYPEFLVHDEELDPVIHTFTFTYGASTYTLRKLLVMKRLTRADNSWFDNLLRYLRDANIEIPTAPADDDNFQSPKKTCKSPVSSLPSAVPVSNSFAALAPPSITMDAVDSHATVVVGAH